MLQLLAAVQRVTVLEQAHVVLSDLCDNVLGSVDLAEGEFVVISVVQDVD